MILKGIRTTLRRKMKLEEAGADRAESVEGGTGDQGEASSSGASGSVRGEVTVEDTDAMLLAR